jgi:hypothetical protein
MIAYVASLGPSTSKVDREAMVGYGLLSWVGPY